MKPSIKIINSTLDFPIYEGSDQSLRNKITKINGSSKYNKAIYNNRHRQTNCLGDGVYW